MKKESNKFNSIMVMIKFTGKISRLVLISEKMRIYKLRIGLEKIRLTMQYKNQHKKLVKNLQIMKEDFSNNLKIREKSMNLLKKSIKENNDILSKQQNEKKDEHYEEKEIKKQKENGENTVRNKIFEQKVINLKFFFLNLIFYKDKRFRKRKC